MKQNIVVIGGGIAGLEASKSLTDFGYNIYLIEKSDKIGGNVNNWYHLFPNYRDANEIRDYAEKITKSENITIFKETEITNVIKNSGKFQIDTNKGVKFSADAILVSTGFKTFDAERKEEYGYKIYDNVITSVDLEQKFRKHEQVLTADGKVPKRVAFVHCVGSRDAKVGNTYCSKVCCITGVKQAIEIQKKLGTVENFCFYMDLRMFNLEYESFYRDAQEKHYTQFIRGRVSEVAENKDGSLQVKAEDTLSGLPLKMKVDLLVLLVGMEPADKIEYLTNMLGIEVNSNRFIETDDVHLFSNKTSKDGVFVAGTCIGPMTITETIQHSRSAALEIHSYLKNRRL